MSLRHCTCEDRARRGLAVHGADPKHALAAAQPTDPGTVAAEVPVAGMPQRPRMGVHDADDRQPPVGLAHDAAAQRLAQRIELYVRDARIAAGAGRQRRQDHRLARLAPAKDYPAGLLVAAGARAVPGELLE
jgi:hypothetical protein